MSIQLTEEIWYREYQIGIARQKTGRAIRKMYPSVSDGRVQDLTYFIEEGYEVEVSTDPNVWIEAYNEVGSCMQGKGDLCERAYSPHEVSIAVLRTKGVIIARCLVRKDPVRGYTAYKAYGVFSYLLIAVLETLGGVYFTCEWMPDDLLVFTERSGTSRLQYEINTVTRVPGGRWVSTGTTVGTIQFPCVDRFVPYIDGRWGEV